MPLETASFIHQLDPSNPAGSDQLSQGDDHLRLIKAAIKATFPNLTGPVTKTQAELNASAFSMPIGSIIIWYGDSNTVPSGWAICNGQLVSRSDGSGPISVPDLRDRVVIGAGNIASRGSIVGSELVSTNTGSSGSHTHAISGGEHTHNATVQGHALTEAQLPSHRHLNGIGDNEAGIFTQGSTSSPSPSARNPDANAGSGFTEGFTSSVGGGQPHSHGITIDQGTHTHTISTEGAHTHSVQVSTIQPSMGLHYIMKV